jgi:cytochrome c oxidase cbb3-type subunit I/II
VAFAVNFFGTLIKRRERHMYVALWFYIASIVTVAILHIFNNLSMPAGLFKSYSIYAGVQDAFMQWWYGHNAVAFFLTTPFLGLMYYFMPKAAEGPVFSYKLSILHFWSLVFMYIWAGPHHLHYTALPEWASTVGMLFSVMLWAPSWGGMINGLLTLRGAWHKVAQDPILKFFVVAVTAYGMSTFEGPMLSIKSVNALAHYTDWIIAHVHTGALGWNGFMTFGMVYWLLPRLFQAPVYSKKAMELHFWIASVGIVLYVVAIYSAGVTQGLMWRAFDETGASRIPTSWRRCSSSCRCTGCAWPVARCTSSACCSSAGTSSRRGEPAGQVRGAGGRSGAAGEEVRAIAPGAPARRALGALQPGAVAPYVGARADLFTVLTTLAVVVASLFEILPTFLIKSNVPTIASVKPYTPLELAGRDIYIAEGCFNCHSQMIRPFRYETERFGEYSKPGESVYEHPFLWGSRRIGPDLARQGGKYPDLWHVRHFENPRAVTAQVDHAGVRALPHQDDRLRADPVAGRRDGDGGGALRRRREQGAGHGPGAGEADRGCHRGAGRPDGLEDKQIVAMVAYMQRLGRDIKVTSTAQATASPPRPWREAPTDEALRHHVLRAARRSTPKWRWCSSSACSSPSPSAPSCRREAARSWRPPPGCRSKTTRCSLPAPRSAESHG